MNLTSQKMATLITQIPYMVEHSVQKENELLYEHELMDLFLKEDIIANCRKTHEPIIEVVVENILMRGEDMN
jgi:hypothetical protein